ncbi:TRAP transporter substrate-binding protein [Cereibacter johrii]|uniref:TRAP transporter substrate-binding protein n=1 Tax=Cereibacter johrii TaxID=445629 RepID=UPI000DCD6DEC|nr:TRAP transporter substrate-binding protein [Cereibacter johrii]RAZ85260.1 C4-dicarboxylate ABC transporter [Cereibacter johrii]
MRRACVKTMLGFALALTAGMASAEDLRWKMPIGFGSNLPGLGSPSPWVADMLTKASGGSIEVRVYEPGKLMPAFDILQAVSDGKVPVGYTWIGYDQGKVPAVPLFAAVPFGMKPWAFTAWYYYGEGHDLLQEVYANAGYNVRAQLCGIIGPETAGWYKNEISKVEDYQGLKIRFAGLGGKVIEKLGASVSVLPSGDLFQALETGTIDATEFSMPAIDKALGFGQVAKFNLFPGWHQPFTAQYLLINNAEWEKTTESQRALIEAVCTAAVTRALAEGEFLNGAVLEGFEKDGISAKQIPDEVLAQLKAVTDEVLEEEAAKNADFKRVYESQNEFLESYRVWEERAYLYPKLD